MQKMSLALLLIAWPFQRADAALLEFNQFAIPALQARLPDPRAFSRVLTFQHGVVIADHLGYNGEPMQSPDLNGTGACNLRIVYSTDVAERLDPDTGLLAYTLSGTALMEMLSYSNHVQDQKPPRVRLKYFSDTFPTDAGSLSFVQKIGKVRVTALISAIECAGPVAVDLTQGATNGDALLQQLISGQIGPSVSVYGQ